MIKKLTLHRLAGALIILIVGAVVYKTLFKYKHAEHVVAAFVVPPAPAQPHTPAFMNNTVISKNNKTSSAITPEAHHSLPTSWVIHVASFDNTHEADTLLKTLIKHRFTAFSSERVENSKQKIMVFVGPDLDKNQLQKQVEMIDKKLHVSGKIIPFRLTGPMGVK